MNYLLKSNNTEKMEDDSDKFYDYMQSLIEVCSKVLKSRLSITIFADNINKLQKALKLYGQCLKMSSQEDIPVHKDILGKIWKSHKHLILRNNDEWIKTGIKICYGDGGLIYIDVSKIYQESIEQSKYVEGLLCRTEDNNRLAKCPKLIVMWMLEIFNSLESVDVASKSVLKSKLLALRSELGITKAKHGVSSGPPGMQDIMSGMLDPDSPSNIGNIISSVIGSMGANFKGDISGSPSAKDINNIAKSIFSNPTLQTAMAEATTNASKSETPEEMIPHIIKMFSSVTKDEKFGQTLTKTLNNTIENSKTDTKLITDEKDETKEDEEV